LGKNIASKREATKKNADKACALPIGICGTGFG